MPANEANGVGGRSYGRIVLYLQRVSPAEWYIYIHTYIHMYVAVGLLLRMTQILVLHLQVVLLLLFAVFNRLLRLSLVTDWGHGKRQREKREGKSLTTGFDRNLRVCVCVWVFVLCVCGGLGNVQWSGFVRVVWDFKLQFPCCGVVIVAGAIAVVLLVVAVLESGRVGGSRRGGGCSGRGDGGGGAAAAAGAVVQWCSEHLKQHPLPERSDQLRAGVGCSRGSRCPVSRQENVGDACH